MGERGRGHHAVSPKEGLSCAIWHLRGMGTGAGGGPVCMCVCVCVCVRVCMCVVWGGVFILQRYVPCMSNVPKPNSFIPLLTPHCPLLMLPFRHILSLLLQTLWTFVLSIDNPTFFILLLIPFPHISLPFLLSWLTDLIIVLAPLHFLLLINKKYIFILLSNRNGCQLFVSNIIDKINHF